MQHHGADVLGLDAPGPVPALHAAGDLQDPVLQQHGPVCLGAFGREHDVAVARLVLERQEDGALGRRGLVPDDQAAGGADGPAMPEGGCDGGRHDALSGEAFPDVAHRMVRDGKARDGQIVREVPEGVHIGQGGIVIHVGPRLGEQGRPERRGQAMQLPQGLPATRAAAAEALEGPGLGEAFRGACRQARACQHVAQAAEGLRGPRGLDAASFFRRQAQDVTQAQSDGRFVALVIFFKCAKVAAVIYVY